MTNSKDLSLPKMVQKPAPKLAIAIPARYASSRFPGKPLAKIQGKTMLWRVVDIARRSIEGLKEKYPALAPISIFVTTEDERISTHAKECGVDCIITDPKCPTGSDRVLAALKETKAINKDNPSYISPDFIINLQGDAPFTPPDVVIKIFEEFISSPDSQVITPVQRLSWSDLDRLRGAKKETPFSGTTAIIGKDNKAIWFSKNIIPAIRKEQELREKSKLSPVFQHIGLYGFRTDILEKFCSLSEGEYERLEGLEQLRMLENAIEIKAVEINLPDGNLQSGIDTPQDLERANSYLNKNAKLAQ